MTDGPPVDVEFLVEPFTEGSPGVHVEAAIDAVEAHGLDVEVGPFGNVARGSSALVATAMSEMARAAMDSGADRVTITYSPSGAEQPTSGQRGLHDALSRIVSSIENELGAPLEDLSRADKQAAVRLLDESGAFLLKRSIEDVAERMGVSRITIYNYLNAMRGE